MKKIGRIQFLFTFVLLFWTITFSQTDKNSDKYKYRNLSELTAVNRQNTAEVLMKAKLEEQFDFISFDLFYSRVRVQFTGDSRPISQNRKDLINTWGKLQNADKKLISLYENEFLFKECETEYWIPMQKKVGDNISKKAGANEPVTLFVINVGGRKAAMSKEYDWLFLSTAFEK